jgi:hypothetical protein
LTTISSYGNIMPSTARNAKPSDNQNPHQLHGGAKGGRLQMLWEIILFVVVERRNVRLFLETTKNAIVMLIALLRAR